MRMRCYSKLTNEDEVFTVFTQSCYYVSFKNFCCFLHHHDIFLFSVEIKWLITPFHSSINITKHEFLYFLFKGLLATILTLYVEDND